MRVRASVGALIGLAGGLAVAAGPGVMNFQATVSENGRWVTTNSLPVTFALYGSAAGGSAVYRECDHVAVEQGHYATRLGDNPAPGHDFASLSLALAALGSNAWLGVSLCNEAELLPRQLVTSAPFVLTGGVSAGPGPASFSVTGSYTFVSGTTQCMDRLTVNELSAGEGRFERGIAFLAPLGDLAMGVYTNRP